MSDGDLILLYSKTFNAPTRSRQVYAKMMEKYDKFFTDSIKKETNKLKAQLSGLQVNEMIKMMVEFYDHYQAQKHTIK